MTLRDLFAINTWWGKIIGAFLGYISAGSMGAFIGVLVGNLFDKGLSSHFSNPHFLYHSEKRQAVQNIFFQATFSVMGHIAKADGYVSAQEIEMARVLMDEMRLNKQQQDEAKRLFTEGKQVTFRLDVMIRQLQKACKDNRELLKLFIDIQYRAAQVDGLSMNKIKALNLIFSNLGFAPLHQQYRFFDDFGYSTSSQYSDEEPKSQHQRQYRQQNYQKPHQSPKNYLDHAYALLEVVPTASKQEVKKAYRRLLSKNHPDKLIAQGLPEAMIKMANEKTQKIVKAYELICQTKGW